MTLTGRVGRFLALFGGVLLLIFFASDLAREPKFDLFFWGFICVVSGILMMNRGRVPPTPSERFRLIRSLRNRGKKVGGGDDSDSGNASEEGQS